jgi:hydroxymethylglutaryl-CoA lyase
MKIIECPRDAMQGMEDFIPTIDKVNYIDQLLKVGFDTLDFGSFVSPKAIPQMRDTALVLEKIQWRESRSKLLAIVGNLRGAEQASTFEGITYLGFPLSVSETFQLRNTNKSIGEAFNTIEEIQNLCLKTNKKLVTYLSMGFGNPYNDPYNVDLVNNFVDILIMLGVDIISLADTVGVSTPESIRSLFITLTQQYPKLEVGVHLHSNPFTAREKIEAAFTAGCRRFDGAIRGFGGCPMANDELVGNIATETLLSFFNDNKVNTAIDLTEFNKALIMADKIFLKH